jgi:hypothetical protein
VLAAAEAAQRTEEPRRGDRSDGGQRQRQGRGGRSQGRPAKGGGKQAHGQRGKHRQKYAGDKAAPSGNSRSRPEQGIGGVGFMNKPRSGGMQRGSAYRD